MYEEPPHQKLQLIFTKKLPQCNSSILEARVLNSASSRKQLLLLDGDTIKVYDLESCSLLMIINFSVTLAVEYSTSTLDDDGWGQSKFEAHNIAVDETQPNQAILLLTYKSKKILTRIPIGKRSHRFDSWKVCIDCGSGVGSDSREFYNSLSCDDEGRVYAMFRTNGKPRGQVGVFDFESGKLLGVLDFNNGLPKSFTIGSFKVTRKHFYIEMANNTNYRYTQMYDKHFPLDEFYTKENSLTKNRCFDVWDLRGCHYRVSHITEVDTNGFIGRTSYEIIEYLERSSIKYSNQAKSIIYFDRKRGELYCSVEDDNHKTNTIVVYKYSIGDHETISNNLFKLAVHHKFVDIFITHD